MTEGIPYFSLDCRFDDKLEEIEDMFGMKGLGIIIKLFQKIYGIHGYYCEWNDRVASRFANREAFVGVDVVREVVAAALRESKNHESLFDKEMYTKYGILTSRGIQKRYLKAAKSLKRKDIFPVLEYVIIPLDDSDIGNSGKNADISGKSSENSGKNGDISSLNEKKRNEMKLKEKESRTAAPPAPSPTREQLVRKYREKAVALYEQKYQNWQQRKGISGGISYARIAEWLIADGVPEQNSSIDQEDILRELQEQYSEEG